MSDRIKGTIIFVAAISIISVAMWQRPDKCTMRVYNPITHTFDCTP